MTNDYTPYVKDFNSSSGILYGYYKEPITMKDMLRWTLFKVEYDGGKDLGYIENKYLLPDDKKGMVEVTGTYWIPRKISLEKALSEINGSIKGKRTVYGRRWVSPAEEELGLYGHKTKIPKTHKGVKTAVCGKKQACKGVIEQLENSVRKMF